MVKRAIITILVAMCICSSSYGAWVFWENGTGNNQWTDSTNWSAYPTANDDTVVQLDKANEAILNTGEIGLANWMHVSSDMPGGSQLTLNGGTVNCNDHLIVGENWGPTHEGTILMNSGTINTTLLLIGGAGDGSNGKGNLIMNDGDINISWMLAIAGGYGGTTGGGVGVVELDGGTLNATGGGGLVMSNNGSLDITDGALVLAGNITDVTTFGNVTAFDGIGSFVYNFDGANTTITAIPEPLSLLLVGFGVLFVRNRKR